jgi:hypothetical protein
MLVKETTAVDGLQKMFEPRPVYTLLWFLHVVYFYPKATGIGWNYTTSEYVRRFDRILEFARIAFSIEIVYFEKFCCEADYNGLVFAMTLKLNSPSIIFLKHDL